jgi:hypothetical protein
MSMVLGLATGRMPMSFVGLATGGMPMSVGRFWLQVRLLYACGPWLQWGNLVAVHAY